MANLTCCFSNTKCSAGLTERNRLKVTCRRTEEEGRAREPICPRPDGKPCTAKNQRPYGCQHDVRPRCEAFVHRPKCRRSIINDAAHHLSTHVTRRLAKFPCASCAPNGRVQPEAGHGRPGLNAGKLSFPAQDLCVGVLIYSALSPQNYLGAVPSKMPHANRTRFHPWAACLDSQCGECCPA